MSDGSALTQRFAILRNRALLTLMLSHFTVDMYVGLLPLLYPLLTAHFNLDLKTVGLVTLAYSGMASISQPLFGMLADRYGTRWIGLAPLWTTLLFATIGFAPSFPVLLMLAGAAGLGSGAFHPMGAIKASAVIPAAQRNMAMSVYVTGGTLGVALGPLLGAVIFTLFGTRGTAVLLVPGVALSLWLISVLGRSGRDHAPVRRDRSTARRPVPVLPLIVVIGLMMSRNWTLISLEAFVPTWYKTLGYGPSFYGPLATTLILASAFGTIGCGSLADRYGRRAVMIGSLILSIPVLVVFALFPGPGAFVSGALVGLLAASTGPLMLVMAQQLLEGNAGMASGLVLGLGFITGAVGVPITGAIADAYGMQAALLVHVAVVAATILLALLLPTEKRLRQLTQPVAVVAGTD